MCKFNPKNQGRRIDPCMINLINYLRKSGVKTLSCCCGHRKYPMSLVVREGTEIIEIFNNKILWRKNRFYKKDKQGYYFIPEVIKKGANFI